MDDGKVDQDDGKIFVHQKRYIKKLLELYGMKECNADISNRYEREDGRV